jgi:DNA-binding response OmpR family regulator
MSAHILIIEDNRDLALGLRTSLEVEGYRVDVAEDGEEGLARVRADRPDLIVLDLMLPRLSGFHVLRTMREENIDLPVLILSARGEEADKVQGFRLGADNYAVKPIGVLELLARVEAMLKRASQTRRGRGGDLDQYAFAGIEVDATTRTVLKNGRTLEVSPKEFDLLFYLLRRNGAVVRRDELLREVWGYKRSVPTRTIDAHIAMLRGKLEEDASNPRYLLTVRKAGYRLDREGGAGSAS